MKYKGIFTTTSPGQALVEAALFFPMLIVVLAGLVEVGQLVVTQNKITDAARAGARFGAQGGQDVGILNVVANSVTHTLGIDESVWDIWIVRGLIDDSGSSYADWEFSHAHGYSNTIKAPIINEDNIKQLVLSELQKDHTGANDSSIASGLEFVGVYAIHDVESILGLEAIPALSGINSISELSLMRISNQQHDQTAGCSAFPIAVHEGIRSVTPPGEGSFSYPESHVFDYPDSPPDYHLFYKHVSDVPLLEAKPGYLYRIHNGFGTGNFGWLRWNLGRSNNVGTLSESLTWPGDSLDYTNHGDSAIYPAADAYPHIVRGFVEYGDATDTSMHIGDWVAANTGSIKANDVRNSLGELVDDKQYVRVIIWDESAEQGSNGRYKIAGFAVFRLVGYSLDQGHGGSWILAEFLRFDDSCGQVAN